MLTISFELHSEIELPQDIIDSVPSQGAADSAIDELLDSINMEVSLSDSIAYLKSFGAWETNELQDLDTNKARILWLACGCKGL